MREGGKVGQMEKEERRHWVIEVAQLIYNCICLFLAHLEQQFTDLVLALGSSLVERSELPQVHHVHVAHVLHHLFRHLVVAVGTCVVQRNKTTGNGEQVMHSKLCIYMQILCNSPSCTKPTHMHGHCT